jgi:hypothetical protein
MLLLAAAAATAMACEAQPARRKGPPFGRDAAAFTPKGWSGETVSQPDLNADGRTDLVVVVRDDEGENRRMTAAVATAKGYRNVGEAELPPYPLGSANVEFKRSVLVVTDLTGGTTADQTVYRYRYEGPSAMQGAMRFIGMDIGHYSRTNQHDSLELSFNWLTGGFSKQVNKLTKRGDYRPLKPVTGKSDPRCVFMEDTENPENYVEAELETDPE